MYKFKTKPEPHQFTALKRAIKKNKYGVFFQQRVGKTKVAIDFCGIKHVSEDANKVLIVCPLSVRTEWNYQVDEHLPEYIDREFILYPSNQKKRLEIIKNNKPNKLTFLCINYDIIDKQSDRLLKWNPDIIIFDESHLIKNYNSRRSKASYKIAKEVKNVLLLTGTPIPKKWYDIFGQFRAMDASIFGHRWTPFKNKYAIMGGYMGKEIIGCTNKDEIADIIAKHSIRVLRKDVFDEPNIENVIIPVTLEPKAMEHYKQLRDIYVAELDNGQLITADMAGVRLMRLQQLCGGWLKDDTGNWINISSAKIEITIDLIKTKVEGGEQVVVFHRFQREGRDITEKLKKCGINTVEFNGNVSENERKKARDDFQQGNAKVIVMQIATGAMGITLDKAHINVFYSLDFSLANFLQARDRVMGRNQKYDVTNYFIACKNTVDHKVMKTLSKDEDLASSIVDKWRWLLDD